jgi:hypothetical protein
MENSRHWRSRAFGLVFVLIFLLDPFTPALRRRSPLKLPFHLFGSRFDVEQRSVILTLLTNMTCLLKGIVFQ